jgi:hypothetical protein
MQHFANKNGKHSGHAAMAEGDGHYGRLLAMVALSYVAMYVLMYAMVNTFDNVFNNVNQVYMAGLMAAPMVPIELALMRRMYPNKVLNGAVVAIALLVMLLCWLGIRHQAAVSDRQFLRSMIPHHAGAILMCRQNKLSDPELQQLCKEIIDSQQAEIELMKRKLQQP